MFVVALGLAGCGDDSTGGGEAPTDTGRDTASDTEVDTATPDSGRPEPDTKGGEDVDGGTTDTDPDGTADTQDDTSSMSEKIAYVKGDHIYVANADGSGEVQLTQQRQNSEPAWSPDGTTIVYKSRTDAASGWELWTIAADGTGAQKLFGDPAISDIGHPDWSPDGSEIVFHGDHPSADSFDILTVDVDGANATPVVSTAANESSPAWSPDGQKIVYASDMELREVPATGGSSSNLAGPFNDLLRGNSAFTPAGDKIVFELGDQEADLYTIDADGANQNQITSNANLNFAPSVSADGQTIAYYHFSYDGAQERGIWTVDISGGSPQKLIENADEPAYSP